MDADDALRLLLSDPGRTGIFTDFDGTLSPIVNDPALARPVGGAEQALEALAGRFAIVGVVSGRGLEDLRSRLSARGVVLAGAYGRERSDRPAGRRAPEGWETVAVAAAAMLEDLPGVVLERKGAGVALHYRRAPERAGDVRRVAETLSREFALELRPGRRVVELVRPGPGKSDAIAALASEHELRTLMLAGDDVADAEAFAWARSSPMTAVLVAVASQEAPAELEAMADVVVPDPGGLLGFLRGLVASS